ncbi:MAG: hypothetical protein IT462_11290, partial [Planctomycetes bacterium]|nr:hypothetical protein [Planctomycetota bacterium]
YFSAVALSALAGFAFGGCDKPARSQPGYDPLSVALASVGKTRNFEATVPSMCYTRTDGVSNPCWTCHTQSVFPNQKMDYELQEEYAFSDVALTNHWTNLFVDHSSETAAISDDAALKYIRTDNYRALRAALKGRADYPGYVPDLDFDAGFDEEGFARDGSGWRALRYKPFLGTFWPTNGNTDDVMIRLPADFQRDESGQYSRAVYVANFAILEAAICGGADAPTHYTGKAASIAVVRNVYPQGTEYLHSVRYVDPDAPNLVSKRMKELRYSRKVHAPDTWAITRAYEEDLNKKQEGMLPHFGGRPETGYLNDFGWQLQGFIEDERGRLRLQTEEEHLFCMGCHSALGITVDQTFTLPRKVPGAEGWRYQDLRGMHDAPQKGHPEPEILTYFKRVKGGDEFRANDEILARFFRSGALKEEEVRRAARGGDKDVAWLLTPSRERALKLTKAYMALVKRQGFDLGRDTMLAPPGNVFANIENGDTALGQSKLLFRDGTLRLDWSR